VWDTLVVCLLTTQNSADRVDRWREGLLPGQVTKPQTMRLSACRSQAAVGDLEAVVLNEIATFRRKAIVARQLVHNLRVLDGENGWLELDHVVQLLMPLRQQSPDPNRHQDEREVARWLQLEPHQQGLGRRGLGLQGLGPKQSRNFLQGLGLTRYEIPIDSRLISWCRTELNLQHFPVPGLADERFYSLVCDRIRDLCLQANVLPCMFDAAVFSLGTPRRRASKSKHKSATQPKLPARPPQTVDQIVSGFPQHAAMYHDVRSALLLSGGAREFTTGVRNQIRFELPSVTLGRDANVAGITFRRHHITLALYFGAAPDTSIFKRRISSAKWAEGKVSPVDWHNARGEVLDEIAAAKTRRGA
jgi:hypothetical protein